jgi:hypothetical protein
MRRRDPLACHNERVKSRATYLNALSLAFIGFAFLRPLVEGTLTLNFLTVTFLLTGVALHAAAHYLLRHLEKDD